MKLWPTFWLFCVVAVGVCLMQNVPPPSVELGACSLSTSDPVLDCDHNSDLDDLKEYSSCIYNYSVVYVAILSDEEISDTSTAESLVAVANWLLNIVTAAGQDCLAEGNDTTPMRDLTDYDEDDEVKRSYFLDIHFLEDGEDPNNLVEPSSESSDAVQEYSRIAQQAYRIIENAIDALGELGHDTEHIQTMNISKDGVSILSETVPIKDISSVLSLSLNASGSDGIQKTISVNISEDIAKAVRDMDADTIQIQLTEVLNNPYFDDSTVLHSPVVSLAIKDHSSHHDHIGLTFDNVKKPFELRLPLNVPEKNMTDADASNSTNNETMPPYQQRNLPLRNLTDKEFHPFHMALRKTDVVVVEIIDPTPGAKYYVAHKKEEIPDITDFCRFDQVLVLDSMNASSEFFAGAGEDEHPDHNHDKDEPGYHVSEEDDFSDYFVIIFVEDPTSNETMLYYDVRFRRAACLSRDEQIGVWSEQGCHVDHSDSTFQEIHCVCHHASTFAGAVFTIPNDIWTYSIFDFDGQEILDNPIILIFVCVLLVIYFFGMWICFFLDRYNREEHIGLTVMTDLQGDLDHHGYYLITVITANRFGAGTTANACIQLYGTNGRSQIYVLKEPNWQGLPLQRGGIDTFLVSSRRWLGAIERIRLWHDNSGNSPHWHCRKVLIKDIKNDEEFFFFVDKWLHITGKESTVIYEKDSATEKENQNFFRRFKKNFVDHLDNTHLWFSVAMHPQATTFTRCQRLSVAFATFCIYMSLNMVAYDVEMQDPRDPFGIGSYLIAVQISLIELPCYLILVHLFRRIRQRQIPTLIVWRNRSKKQIIKQKRTSLYIPTPRRKSKRASGSSSTDSIGSDLSDDKSQSSNISIESTDENAFENWVGDESKKGDKDKGFVHANPNKKGSDADPALGRVGLLHAARHLEPNSFIYSGDNDLADIEGMVDEDLKQSLIKAQNAKKEEMKDKQTPTMDETLEQVGDDVYKSRYEGQHHSSHIPIVFETCEMRSQQGAFCLLPWWFIFFAWALCIAAILVSLYFLLIYGLHYGYLRSLDWLFRIMICFLISVFVIEPMNIFVYSLMYTLCCTTKNWSVLDEERFQVLIKDKDNEEKRTPLKMKVAEPQERRPPLSNAKLFEYKVIARRWERVKGALTKLIIYGVLFIPLVVFTYIGHNPDDYLLVSNMKNLLQIDGPHADIKSNEDVFDYLKTVVIPALNPEEFYNGVKITKHRFGTVLLSDGQNYLVGVPRIRQLRVRKEPCHVPISVLEIFPECYYYFSSYNQDTKSYNPSWAPVNGTRHGITDSNDVWKFRGNKDDNDTNFLASRNFQGYKAYYEGNGYVAELGRWAKQSRSVLRYLYHTDWIDQQTRAIFVEFTTFNPTAETFLDVKIVIERGPSHSYETTFTVIPVRLTQRLDLLNIDVASGQFAFIWLLIGLGVLIVIILMTVIDPPERQLYKRFWFWLDLLMVGMLALSIGIATIKDGVMYVAVDLIQTMKTNEYISLQDVGYWEVINGAAFSITECICIVKIFQLLVFVEGGFLVTSLIMKLSINLVIAYFIALAIILVAFSSAAHVFFGSALQPFNTFLHSFVTLVGQSVLVTMFEPVHATEPVTGALFSVAFSFVVAFIFINILVAILNETLIDAKAISHERLRNWGFEGSLLLQIFRKRNAPFAEPEVKTVALQPHRVDKMCQIIANYLRFKLQSQEAIKLENMKVAVNEIYRGTGYHAVRKKPSEYHEKVERETKMDAMRLHAAEYLKKRTGADMDPEELQKYNDVNKAILQVKIKQLEELAWQLEKKVESF